MKLLKSELKILNSKDNKDYSIDDYRRQQEKALYQSKLSLETTNSKEYRLLTYITTIKELKYGKQL